MHSVGAESWLPPASSRPSRSTPLCSLRTAAARGMSPVWLDVDAGVDDAQGLMLALAQPQLAIMGISAVHGNVGVDQVGRNIARVLLAAGRKGLRIPFYLGASEPYLAEPVPSTHWYGKDGLGDAPDAPPTPQEALELQPEAGHAAVHLAAAAQRAGGQLTVVATGPATNIALAAEIDLAFPQNVKELVVMGGAEGRGNATDAAEFNFYWDAEAAHVVLKTFPKVTLLTWDCCLSHRQPWSLVDSWLCKATPKARFLSAIMRSSMEKERAGSGEVAGWIACDPLAVALALAPDQLITAAEWRQCRVELAEGPGWGRSVFGSRGIAGAGGGLSRWQDGAGEGAVGEGSGDGGQLAAADGWGVVRLVKGVDMARFAEMMDASLE